MIILYSVAKKTLLNALFIFVCDEIKRKWVCGNYVI